MFLIFAIPLGLVAAFCLRMAWVGLFLRDGLPMSLGFGAFAGLMIYMIAAIGWKTFGPSMILTPNQIIHPGAFRNLRTPIRPDTQVIRWDRRYTKRAHNNPGEATLKFKIETSMLLMDGGAATAYCVHAIWHWPDRAVHHGSRPCRRHQSAAPDAKRHGA